MLGKPVPKVHSKSKGKGKGFFDFWASSNFKMP